jgi:ankyrin repeat protein
MLDGEITADAVRAAARNGMDFTCSTSDTWTPLDYAIFHGRMDLVRVLLDVGVDPNARWSWRGDRFPLQEAIEDQWGSVGSNRAELVRLLLRHGADPHLRWCPFESRGSIGQIQACRSEAGVTALIAATVRDQADVVYVLLDHGADPLMEDGLGSSALDYANGGAVFDLLAAAMFRDAPSRAANVLAYLENRPPTQGFNGPTIHETPLERAISGGHGSWVSPPPPPPPPLPPNGWRPRPRDIPDRAQQELSANAQRVALVLGVGADPNERLTRGQDSTPLAIAIFRRDPGMVEVLLKAGADPDGRWCAMATGTSVPFSVSGCGRDRGFTALMAAAGLGDAVLIEVLLKHRADPAQTTWDGRRALDFAGPAASDVRRALESAERRALP